MTNNDDLIDVWVDEGSAGVKTLWINAQGEIQTHLLPSRVIDEAATTGAGEYSQQAYTADGMEYTVTLSGDGTLPTNTRSYQISPYNRVLVHEALRRAGFAGKRVRITTTLPIGDFLAVKPRNDALINQKKENLLKPVENMAGCELAEIVEVLVSPEAIPAWFNYLIDTDGEIVIEADEESRIIVVDCGGTTIDFAIIDGLGNILRFGSVRVGGFQVGENLRPLLIDRFKRKVVETHQIDKAFKSGKFAGEDISEEIAKACAPIEQKILIALEQFQPNSDEVDAILYVGGLSALIAERVSKQYGGHTIIGNEYSIVSGMAKEAIATRGVNYEQATTEDA